jgi:hypothetical protein
LTIAACKESGVFFKKQPIGADCTAEGQKIEGTREKEALIGEHVRRADRAFAPAQFAPLDLRPMVLNSVTTFENVRNDTKAWGVTTTFRSFARPRLPPTV